MSLWQLEAGGLTEEWHGAWRYGIVAHPVIHSLSPPMQLAAFREHNINATFDRFNIAPEALADFIAQVRDEPINGLAVSLPHKESIIPLLDEITPTARAIGAVNTVYWQHERLWGDNTDAPGFWQAIESHAPDVTALKKALVIGAGGAARAIVFILRLQGIEVTIANRTRSRAEELATQFGAEATELDNVQSRSFDLIVNSTSVGLKACKSPVSADFWQGFSGIAFDAVFDPLVTKFLADAKSAGADIITGETMLLYQGTRQFTIWTGKAAPVEVMRSALESEMQK